MNRYLIPELVDFNFTTDRYPKIRFEQLGGKDMAAFSTTLTQLITAGVIDPDEELQRVVREQLGLPPKDEATTNDPNDVGGDAGDAEDETIDDPNEQQPVAKETVPADDTKVEAHEHKHDGDC